MIDIKCPNCNKQFTIRATKLELMIKDLEAENKNLKERLSYLAKLTKTSYTFPWLDH